MTNKQLEALAEEKLESKAKEIYGKGWQKALIAFRILAESEPLISNIAIAAMKEMYNAGAKEEAVEFSEWIESQPRCSIHDKRYKTMKERYYLFKSNKTT